MAARVREDAGSHGIPSSHCSWLKELDRRVGELAAGSDWSDDPQLAPQRCRRFLMTRFPELRRFFPNLVLRNDLSQGRKLIQGSDSAEWILRDLKPKQKRQLAGLLLDIIEALEFYVGHTKTSKSVSKLHTERSRRERMLLRMVVKIRLKLEHLREYAKALNPLLGLEYVHAANRCLKFLANLEEKPSEDEFYRSLKSEYPSLEDPRQLGMIQLYCFFRYECRCSGADSEVRVAMLATDFLKASLHYTVRYTGDETKGCPAVRIAVSRFRPFSSPHNEPK